MDDMTVRHREKQGMTAGTGGLVTGTVLIVALHLVASSSYLLFHSIAEGFSICISVAIFLFAWNSRRFMDHGYFLLLGIASLFTGIMDGVHMLAYKGMGVFGEQDPNPATQVWIATRYLYGISLLVAPVFLKRPVKIGGVFALYAAVTTLSLLSIFSWGVFPDCYVQGVGLTPFKIASEYLIVLVLLGSLGLALSFRQSFNPQVLCPLSGSIVFSVAAELAFTQYLGVYDIFNQLGHVFKIIASYLLYRAVIFTGLRTPYNLIFRSLKQNQEELNGVNLELKQLAEKQHREIDRRRKAEDELRSHRDNLEACVQARTQELEERNRLLAAEVAVRMKAEADLQKSLEESEDLYQKAPCGYHSVDPDGVYLLVNDTELAWFGYTREELVGRARFHDLVTPASRKTVEEAFPVFKKRGWIRDIEVEVIRRDGEVVPIILSATAILDSAGTYVRSRSTLFNVAERKKMEEEKRTLESQLLQAQKMEALGRFAGGIAHDLNNMLYPIILNAQALLAEIPAGTPWFENMELILNAAYRQRDLVKQILSFGRHQDQSRLPIRVKPLVDDTLAFLRSTLPKTIELVQHGEPGDDTVLGSATQIQQIIMNLCRNAADAIEPGAGLIEVGIENVRHGQGLSAPGGKSGEYVRITVRDTGCGMTPEVRRQIFEPFFTTKDVGKGTGMGLAVVHGILKNHGAGISVWSEPGKGSRFTIDLPLTGERLAESVPLPVPASPAGETKRVLVVDDEESILTSLQRVFRVIGYEAVMCPGSREALELFTASPDTFDLVVTDQTMPFMTGVELSRELLRIRPDVPIILCTGYSEAVDEEKVSGMGIRELLKKPADIDEIKAVLGRVTGPPGGDGGRAVSRKMG